MTSGQLKALVVGILVVGGLFAAIKERNERVMEFHERANATALDSIAAAAQERADALDAPLSSVDPNATLRESSLAAPIVDTARVQLTLSARREGSYIDELLGARGGLNVRWPDRFAEPMRIWVQAPQGANAQPQFVQTVRDGFSAWAGLGLPFTFTFILDSARAEIHVTWVERFTELMSGRTHWMHDQHGWIVGGTIELALHQPDGQPLDAGAVGAIARHEVGHLLGLDHTSDLTSIMAARVVARELNEADRRTVRLVYDLPPGRLPR